MAGRVAVPVKLPEELAAWLNEYADKRGATRTAIVEAAVAEFRSLAQGGVPELPAEKPVAGINVTGMSAEELRVLMAPRRIRDKDGNPDQRGVDDLGARSALFRRMTQGAGKPMSYGDGKAK